MLLEMTRRDSRETTANRPDGDAEPRAPRHVAAGDRPSHTDRTATGTPATRHPPRQVARGAADPDRRLP